MKKATWHYLTTKSRIHITELKPNITTSNYCNPIWNKFQFKGMITGYYSLPCILEWGERGAVSPSLVILTKFASFNSSNMLILK